MARLADNRDALTRSEATRLQEHRSQLRSFLGAPIHLSDRTFSNRHFADKRGQPGSTRDDRNPLATVAIDNATLVAEARRQHAWQSAMVDVTTRMLTAGDTGEALRQLVRRTVETADAAGAAVALVTDDPGVLRMAFGEGCYAMWNDELVGAAVSPSGVALAASEAVLIVEPAADPRLAEFAARTPGGLGATVAVAVHGEGGPFGVLLVSRSPRAEAFEPADLELIAAFTGHVGLALRLARVRADHERLRLVEDRQHIAEDLRHRVIGRLFGLGLSLQALTPRVANDAVRDALTADIDEIDAIIRDIRAAVFHLATPQSEDTV